MCIIYIYYTHLYSSVHTYTHTYMYIARTPQVPDSRPGWYGTFY